MDTAMERAVADFVEALKESTADIGRDYFEIHRFGDPAVATAYRERAYCYELYHQLRSKLPDDFPFVLHGELDKRGHDYVVNKVGKPYVPDFLIHRPGTNDNLVITEVKHSRCDESEVRKDIEKMEIFISRLGYQLGILLFFGREYPNISLVESRSITCLHHVTPGQPAAEIQLHEGMK